MAPTMDPLPVADARQGIAPGDVVLQKRREAGRNTISETATPAGVRRWTSGRYGCRHVRMAVRSSRNHERGDDRRVPRGTARGTRRRAPGVSRGRNY
jgi:hypothetical protein